MKIVIGIPARYGSRRFPGKPLALLAGRPMIAHVIERARSAALGEVIVATDDPRIARAARGCGCAVRMTASRHTSGSERLAAALADLPCDVVVNLQGDEPLIDPDALRAVVRPFLDDPRLPMATLARPATSDELMRPDVVKVVCNARGEALYFSRAPIPFPRDGRGAEERWAHVGLYAYRKEFLMIYPSLTDCAAGRSEALEQLRVLHHGYPIAVVKGDFSAFGVDTPEDLAEAERRLLASGGEGKER